MAKSKKREVKFYIGYNKSKQGNSNEFGSPLPSVNFEKFTSISQWSNKIEPITALQMPNYDWSLHRFIEVNFLKLTDSN